VLVNKVGTSRQSKNSASKLNKVLVSYVEY
jgi:hypothetical protein